MNATRRRPLRPSTLLILVCLTAAAPSPAGLWAQDIPKPEMTRLVRQLRDVPVKVASREYRGALQILEQALPVVRGLMREDPAMRVAYAYGIYLKGVCHLELEEYADAEEALLVYIRDFPIHPNITRGRLLLGEAYLYREDYGGIVRVVPPVVDALSTPAAERSMGHLLLGEAYFQLELWEEAMPHLGWLYRNAADSETRFAAAGSLAVCMVRLSRFADLYRVMPHLYRTDAKYDVSLNLTLLEEGDTFLRDDRPDLALLMYRSVVPYSELMSRIRRRELRTEKRIEDMRDVKAGMGDVTARIRQLGRRLEEIREEKEELEAYPDYDMELRIRLGDVYYALERWEEAIQLYLSIHGLRPEHELAERAMFSGYMTAFQAEENLRAWELAQLYMENFPGGEFWDDVTLHAAGLLVSMERWFECVEVVDEALETRPEHVAADNMLYMKGYAQFQQSAIRGSIQTFERMLREFPRSPFLVNAEYWRSLGRLFLQEYEEARSGFQTIVDRGGGGPLREDAFYRLGVSEYGLGDFAASKQTLEAFLEEFPDSILASEALAMIGDIMASGGNLDEAIALYQRAVDQSVNMVQADYAIFQKARTYELEGKWEAIVDLFDAYNQRFSAEEANFTEATYWKGNALKQLGRRREALDLFYDAIVNHGDRTEAFGIDFIIRDLIEEINNLRGAEGLALDLRERLNDEMDRAMEEDETTLLLRLETLQYATTDNDAVKAALKDRLLRERNIEPAAPVTLSLMGRMAVESGNPELARKVYEHFLGAYPESDLILGALVGLSENRIEEERYGEALDLLQSITDRFPTLPRAAEAHMRIGDVHRMLKDPRKAVEAYTLVLSVKEWRGELWPEALLRLGDTYAEMNNEKEAFGYYQRVYVMYIGYPEQAARAYYQSARMLEKMGRVQEAKDTLREMLEQPELAGRDVARDARSLMMKLP